VSTATTNFYNNFSFLYPVIDVFLKLQKRVLFQEINCLPAGHLLEIGIGNGSHLPLYKTHKIVGIDTSTCMLEIAKRQRNPNVELLQMNGENLLFQDQVFDYIVLSHVIAVVDNPEKLLEEACRVLKPNGTIFILNHFTPENWLKYIDKSFSLISKAFHFKSLFDINSLKATKKFTLSREIEFGLFSYFKLLIYNKA